MKKFIVILMLLTSISAADCQTPTEKMYAARATLALAKSQLKAAEKERSDAYPAYKEDAKVQLKANDQAIADMRAKFVKPRRSPLNDELKHKVDSLEEINIQLRDRLYITEW